METEVESMVTVPIQQVSSSVPLLILQSSISHLLNQYLLPVKNHSLQLSPPISALQQSSSVLEMYYNLPPRTVSPDPVAIVASRAVDPVGSPSSTTIDQDEQSTSTSPTNQEIQSQVTHQDDDDDEGPSAGSNQGKSTKRRRHDSGASGSAQPPTKDDEQNLIQAEQSDTLHINIPMQDAWARHYLEDTVNGPHSQGVSEPPSGIIAYAGMAIDHYTETRMDHSPEGFPEPEKILGKYNTPQSYQVPTGEQSQRKTYDKLGHSFKWFLAT
ncbi:hypothetical protein Tco_0047723 [Tanacetum coccineum]